MELKDLLAVAWKRRTAALAVFGLTIAVRRAVRAHAAQALRVDRDAGADARRQAGPGPVRRRQPVGAARHLRRDGQVDDHPAAGRARRSATRLRADIDATTQAGTGILRITARPTDPAAPRPRPPRSPRRSRTRSPATRLLDPPLVNPPVPRPTPVQPRPPLILIVAALLGVFAGDPARVRARALPPRIDTPATWPSTRRPRCIGRLPRSAQLPRAERAAHLATDGEAACRRPTARCAPTSSSCSTGAGRVCRSPSPEPGAGQVDGGRQPRRRVRADRRGDGDRRRRPAAPAPARDLRARQHPRGLSTLDDARRRAVAAAVRAIPTSGC